MKTYPYIQVLSTPQADEHTLSDTDNSAIYQWGMANAELAEKNAQQGNQDELLEWLALQTQAAVLIIPGDKVVVRQVDYNEKEKRHFDKMLPYEVEDDIIGDVDELHFAIGLKQNAQATIAYIDEEWFAQQWDFFVEQGIEISHCFCQFQLIRTEDNETVCWFSEDMLHVHQSNGLGFSCAHTLAPILLQTFLQDLDADHKLSVYMDHASDDENGTSIVNLLHTLAPEIESQFFQSNPELSINLPQAINFCCGPYKNQISGSQWFKEFSGVAALATVAIIAFLSVNLFDIYQLKEKNEQVYQEIEAEFRKEIPQGIMNDPVRQLTRKLSQSSTSNGEPSQAVYLLSIVAPLVQSLNIDLSAINYSKKDAAMRLNIQADSFNVVEKLRTDINNKGLNAELLSSNAVEEKFQARLRVSAGDS